MKLNDISENTLLFLTDTSRREVLSSLRPIGKDDSDLKNLTDLALSVFNADGVRVVLVDSDQSEPLATSGAVGDIDIWTIEAHAISAQDKRCLVVLDAAEDVRFAEINVVAQEPRIRFLAIAPIHVGDKPVGALSVLSLKATSEFTFELEEKLVQFAKLAGSLIELKRNSRLEENIVNQLHRDEDRNAMALEVGNVGSWVWDLKSGIFTGNKMAYTMLGLSDENPVTGEDVFRAMHPDDFPMMKSSITRALAHDQDYAGEFRAASSGQWLLGRGRIFERDESGRPAVAVGVNINITATKNAAEKTRLLLRELNHRVKNTLAMLQSLARQTLNRTSDPAEFMEAFSGRLRAISEAHTLLSDREWSGISLVDLITRQVEPYAIYDAAQMVLVGEDIVLPPDHALGLGIALHELATNAAKHGAFSAAGGQVRVSWEIEPGLDGSRVVIHWVEIGGPSVMARETRGLGERLIERSLDKVISSSVRLSYPESGVEAVISMPIKDNSIPEFL
ncbi:HWE histidine kinase domain-containing protein [Phyllobacterium sp. YR531]|uniref:sensor histidine kinase n=1 Tax=Phyllobacterium sp. YR531 TaxID=1144343 RepID=UPI0005941096|nr:HWE histidine kinase domain-containing protein [Phyllobacterium sp. YR531]